MKLTTKRFCLLCRTRTPHTRVYGDYLPACRAYRCQVCRVEIVIDLQRVNEQEGTK